MKTNELAPGFPTIASAFFTQIEKTFAQLIETECEDANQELQTQITELNRMLSEGLIFFSEAEREEFSAIIAFCQPVCKAL